MPNTTGRRRVRCPNCTAILIEPSTLTPIYECSSCSTLLQAKGSRGNPKGRSTENHLQRTVEDAESFQQTLHGASDLENDKVNNKPSKTHGHHDMECVEHHRNKTPKENNGLLHKDNAVVTYAQDDQSDDMPLYRKRYPRPRTVRTEAFLPKFDPSSSEMPLYTPRRRTSYSPNRSGYSSDKSERGRYFSGLESASYDESETDLDFPSPLSENIHVADQQETIPSVGQTDQFHLEENSDKGKVPTASGSQNIDLDLKDNGETQQEVISYSEGDQSELFSQEEETGKESSEITRGVDSDYGTVKNEKAEAIVSEFYPGDSLIEAVGSRNIATSQSSLTESRISTLCEGDSKGTDPEARHGNEMTWDVSECRKDVQEAVSADRQGEGNDGNHEVAGHLSTSSCLARLVGSMDECAQKLIKTEISDSLEISFCSWQSLKDIKRHEDFVDTSTDADLLDEKDETKSDMATFVGLLSRDSDDITFSTLQQEDPTQKHTPLMDKGIWSIQNQALSSPSADLSTAVLITDHGDHNEKPAIPTMGTEDQVRDEINESKADTNEASYVTERKHGNLLSTVAKSDQLKFVSDNQEMNASNIHFQSASKMQEADKKDGLSDWTEKAEAGSHLDVREDIHVRKKVDLDQKQDSNGSVQQGTALIEDHTLSYRTGNGTPVQGLLSRSYHGLDNRIAPSKRWPTNDNNKTLSDTYFLRGPTSRHSLDLQMAGLAAGNMNGSIVNQGKHLNYKSDSVLEDWQVQKAQSRKYQTNEDAMDQGSVCLLHDPAANFHGYSARMSRESRPDLHLNEQYLSNSFGLSQSATTTRASQVEVPSQGVILSGPTQEHAFNHCACHSVSPVCTFCIQQPHPQVVHNLMRHHCAVCFSVPASMAHQPVLCKCQDSHWASHALSSTYAKSSIGLCQQIEHHPPQAERYNRSISPLVSVARKPKYYPPLPRLGAVPYFLCQGCHLLLEVPSYIPPTASNVQKIRCGGCKKIFKFSIHRQTNNYTASKSSWSSRVASELNLIARASNKPHSVESSTASKVHPEVSTALPFRHGPSFPSNDHARRLLVSKVTESVEPSHPRVLCQMTDFGTGVHAQYEQGKNVLLPRPFASTRSITAAKSLDHMHHPGPAGNVQGQALLRTHVSYDEGKNHLNSYGTYGESYRLPLPPSAFGYTSDHPVLERQKKEAHGSERVVPEGRKMSNGVLLRSQIDEGNQAACLATSFGKDFIERRTELSPVIMQNSHDGCTMEDSGNEPFGRHQMTRTARCQQQHLVESDCSRSSSGSSTDQLMKRPVAPGAPLIEHLNQETAHFAPTLQQSDAHADSRNDGRSAPWSPALGPPSYNQLASDDDRYYQNEGDAARFPGPSGQDVSTRTKYDHFTSDDDRYYQNEADADRFPGPSGQDVSRHPNNVAGLLRKSLRDFGKGGQGNKNGQKVMINGQLIPDAVVSAAEERAGSIDPGSYWYDYKAGFWGVMGGPCLGIIPPFIKELNFPMAKDCAGGNTGVLVNGRELHEKDLQVLVRRGLPTTSSQAYIIDFSGRVSDSASGQQLKSLGKLAPTVEKLGRGYGMSQV